MARIVYKTRELELFFYWINERHAIYLLKQHKQPWPWTADKVLRKYKFTNAFRQLDAVTQAWTTRYHRLLKFGTISNGDLLFQLCLFRFFNWPQTYDSLTVVMGGRRWNKRAALDLLENIHLSGGKIFTGAYIISSGGQRQEKYITIVEALDQVYRDRDMLASKIIAHRSMAVTTAMLQHYNTVGPFVAYEIACDLRHTRILFDATDKLTWANTGPGAARGIHRLLTGKFQKPKKGKIDYVAVMVDLLKRSKYQLKSHVRDCEWPFEMREIEHSLCEYDKWRRVMRREGTPRSLYRPKAVRE